MEGRGGACCPKYACSFVCPPPGGLSRVFVGLWSDTWCKACLPGSAPTQSVILCPAQLDGGLTCMMHMCPCVRAGSVNEGNFGTCHRRDWRAGQRSRGCVARAAARVRAGRFQCLYLAITPTADSQIVHCFHQGSSVNQHWSTSCLPHCGHQRLQPQQPCHMVCPSAIGLTQHSQLLVRLPTWAMPALHLTSVSMSAGVPE